MLRAPCVQVAVHFNRRGFKSHFRQILSFCNGNSRETIAQASWNCEIYAVSRIYSYSPIPFFKRVSTLYKKPSRHASERKKRLDVKFRAHREASELYSQLLNRWSLWPTTRNSYYYLWQSRGEVFSRLGHKIPQDIRKGHKRGEPSRNLAHGCFMLCVLRNPHCVSVGIPSGYASHYAGRFPTVSHMTRDCQETSLWQIWKQLNHSSHQYHIPTTRYKRGFWVQTSLTGRLSESDGEGDWSRVNQRFFLVELQ